MSDLAIWVKGLGKEYRLGEHRRIKTLSGTLNDIVFSPLRRNRSPKPETTKPFWALRDVSFELKQGEILGIIGLNGSGKSTLLKILARITRPTEGSLEVRGRIRPLLEVGVGFHPELTGRENIYLNGSLMGMKRAEIEHHFDEIVAFSGIDEFIDTPVKFYSSGMYVRLAFSTSVHLEPDIILIDEVLAVGDIDFQRKCLKKIDQIRQQGRTIMLVSHNVMQLAELSSRVIWLAGGRIVEQGDPRTVASNFLASGQISDSMLPTGSITASGENIENIAPVSCAEFNPPKGIDGVKARRTYITDENSNIVVQIPYKESFRLVVEYEVDQQREGLGIGFNLYNERDQKVMYASSWDALTSRSELVGTPGQHRASIRIPGAWFAPGRYYVELAIWSPSIGHHFSQSNVFSFDIGRSSLDFAGNEILRPSLDWAVT